MESPTPSPAHRRVTLPSGRTIDVVLFETTGEPDRELHICPECAAELVHPVDWSEAEDGCWRVILRCPNCERIEDGVYGPDVLERLDEALDMATMSLVDDLRQLARANMEDEIERFAAALQQGHVWPMDF